LKVQTFKAFLFFAPQLFSYASGGKGGEAT